MLDIKSNSDIKIQTLKVVLGVLALTALAQVKFFLPLSPIPVTGQTFGVALLALIYGRKLSTISVVSYVALGAAGMPIFSGLKAGLASPTSGYLIGMILSAYVIGGLSDAGAKRSFSKSLMATYAGSFCVFLCGGLMLSLFLPAKDLFLLGIFPFLAGDLVKNLAAAFVASKFFKS